MKTVVALALAFAASVALAHSGGTDSNGCHNERRTGGYHCH
ncbi:YHYH domain-containing protein [Hydrogenophaga intermedia]